MIVGTMLSKQEMEQLRISTGIIREELDKIDVLLGVAESKVPDAHKTRTRRPRMAPASEPDPATLKDMDDGHWVGDGKC